MKANEAMSALLQRTKPAGISDTFDYISFVEWDDCILISSFASNLPSSINKTSYTDRTDCEASVNHLHFDKLSNALDVARSWERTLCSHYPGKAFHVVVSCELDGTEAVARFYQVRQNEPTWVNEETDIEDYKHEAILFLKIAPQK